MCDYRRNKCVTLVLAWKLGPFRTKRVVSDFSGQDVRLTSGLNSAVGISFIWQERIFYLFIYLLGVLHNASENVQMLGCVQMPPCLQYIHKSTNSSFYKHYWEPIFLSWREIDTCLEYWLVNWPAGQPRVQSIEIEKP